MKSIVIPKCNIKKVNLISLISLLNIFVILGCNKTEEPPVLNHEILKGTWIESDLSFVDDNYFFIFKSDSFYCIKESWFDLPEYDDTIHEALSFLYIKGEYILNSNSIILEGMMGYDSNFNEPGFPDTLRKYNKTFDHDLKSFNKLIFNHKFFVEPMVLEKQ